MMEDWREVMKSMTPAERRLVDVFSYLVIAVVIIMLAYSSTTRHAARYDMYVLAVGVLAQGIVRPQLWNSLALFVIAILIVSATWFVLWQNLQSD